MQAFVYLLEHSQCLTLSTVRLGAPGGTVPERRSQRFFQLVLYPQEGGGRGSQLEIGHRYLFYLDLPVPPIV